MCAALTAAPLAPLQRPRHCPLHPLRPLFRRIFRPIPTRPRNHHRISRQSRSQSKPKQTLGNRDHSHPRPRVRLCRSAKRNLCRYSYPHNCESVAKHANPSAREHPSKMPNDATSPSMHSSTTSTPNQSKISPVKVFPTWPTESHAPP